MPTIPGTDTKVTPDMLEPIMAKATTYQADLRLPQRSLRYQPFFLQCTNGKQDQEVGGNSD